MPDAFFVATSSTWSLATWLSFDRDVWSAENGLIENMQAFLLLLAVVIFLVHLVFAKTAQLRLLLLGGVLACLSCLVREVDFEQLTTASWIAIVTSGWTCGAIFLLIWSGYGYACYRFRAGMIRTALRQLQSLSGALVMVAVSLVVVAALYDRQLIKADHPIFMEEMFELGGYLLLSLATALLTLPSGDTAAPHSIPRRKRPRHLIGGDTVEVTSAS